MRHYTIEELFTQICEKTEFLKSTKLKQRNDIISFVNRYV